jgi:hypothetical protein
VSVPEDEKTVLVMVLELGRILCMTKSRGAGRPPRLERAASKVITVRVTGAAFDDLRSLAAGRGESVSAFVRTAIEQRARRYGVAVKL